MQIVHKVKMQIVHTKLTDMVDKEHFLHVRKRSLGARGYFVGSISWLQRCKDEEEEKTVLLHKRSPLEYSKLQFIDLQRSR